tara:strand:+ start:862 stop:1437 length:576 start_codon:yes stop_codon:yes gene_type:complete
MKITSQQIKQIIKEELDSYLKNLNQARAKSFEAGMAKEIEIDNALTNNADLIAQSISRLMPLIEERDKIIGKIRGIKKRLYESRWDDRPTDPDELHMWRIYNEPERYTKRDRDDYYYRKNRRDAIQQSRSTSASSTRRRPIPLDQLYKDEHVELSNKLRRINGLIREEVRTLNFLTKGTHPMLDELSEYLD